MTDRKLPRGVFERPPGSGTFWIRYQDANGKERREKVGLLKAAMQLVDKRRTEVRQQIKLPENFRERSLPFSELAKAALEYTKATHPRSHYHYVHRMAKLVEKFGDWQADKITPEEIEGWLNSHENWKPANRNRYLALFKLTFRLAEANRKIKFNPARLVRMHRENNARVRYLNQFDPLPTTDPQLRPHKTEEGRLRAVIATQYFQHLPELEIALNTGLRRSEQYGLEWSHVNFDRKVLTVARSKHGGVRHVPLNATAVAAFKKLRLGNMTPYVFVSGRIEGKPLRTNRHWFESAVEKAGIRDFHWHDLRHTFASRLVMAKVDLRTVQELLGHLGVGMTVRYSHLAPAHTLAAVELLCAPIPLPKLGPRIVRSKIG